ncbi:hypothetical protein ASZ78_011120, partial [Callipepla squamata]
MDGAWVGTWRPHRPRGLISAQFPSPGPQYSIPGTTGYVGHSPTKTRAPADTFRGTKLPAAESCGPGPCYSVEPAISRTGRYVIPGSYLQGRPKSEIAITPGPSDYCIEAANRHVFKCPPVQSMAFRQEPIRTDRPPGYVGHSPTKTRAPADTFRGTKLPAAESCGPGPCYSVEPAISRTGRYVIPGSYLQGRPKSEIAITPGPSDYCIEAANRHVFKCPPVQSMAFRREPIRTDRPPGPGTYKLPRLLGPNTVYTSASPCYSLRGRSQRGRFDEDLAKVSSAA